MVVVGGRESSILPVLSGVPWGSVLGPLLFINDVTIQISPGSRYTLSLFADDMTLFRTIVTVKITGSCSVMSML